MPPEIVPAGTPTDGRALVLWVPAIADTSAPTVAELSAGTVVDLTYSLVGDGFRHETTENTIADTRYTLRDVLERPGTVVDSLEVQYVAGTPAQTALTAGTIGHFVHRGEVPKETDIAAAQLVDVIPAHMGIQRKVAPTANTLAQRVQKAFITGPVPRAVAIVAGA